MPFYYTTFFAYTSVRVPLDLMSHSSFYFKSFCYHLKLRGRVIPFFPVQQSPRYCTSCDCSGCLWRPTNITLFNNTSEQWQNNNNNNNREWRRTATITFATSQKMSEWQESRERERKAEEGREALFVTPIPPHPELLYAARAGQSQTRL